MKQHISCLLLISTILSRIDTNSALTCYECTQPKGQGLACETNVESVWQTTCATGLSCVKYVWTNMGSSVIYRHCTSLTCSELGHKSTQFDTFESCEICQTDLCNTASSINVSVLLIILYVVCRFL